MIKMNKIKLIKVSTSLSAAFVLTACGSGGSSSGGGDSTPKEPVVNQCVGIETFADNSIQLTNVCSFAINVNIFRTSGTSFTQIQPGATQRDQPLSDGLIVACTAPSQPVSAANGGVCSN
jgi:hypothetical protein